MPIIEVLTKQGIFQKLAEEGSENYILDMIHYTINTAEVSDADNPLISNKAIRQFLRYWVNNGYYLKALESSRGRLNLSGEVVGKVTEAEQTQAMARFQALHPKNVKTGRKDQKKNLSPQAGVTAQLVSSTDSSN